MINTTCMRLIKSKGLDVGNGGATVGMETILNIKNTIENASTTDNTMKSMHVVAMNKVARHEPDLELLVDFLTQNNLTFFARTKASCLSVKWSSRTCCSS